MQNVVYFFVLLEYVFPRVWSCTSFDGIGSPGKGRDCVRVIHQIYVAFGYESLCPSNRRIFAGSSTKGRIITSTYKFLLWISMESVENIFMNPGYTDHCTSLSGSHRIGTAQLWRHGYCEIPCSRKNVILTNWKAFSYWRTIMMGNVKFKTKNSSMECADASKKRAIWIMKTLR